MSYQTPRVPKGRQANTRPKRWARACQKGLGAVQYIRENLPDDGSDVDNLDDDFQIKYPEFVIPFLDIEDALQELEDLKGEYEEWQGNMSENLASSPAAQKLEEIKSLDVVSMQSSSLDDLEECFNNAEGIDLPRGYGKD